MQQRNTSITPEFDLITVLKVWVASMLVGPIGDVVHVLTDTTFYPQETFVFYVWKIPFWVFPLFATAGTLVALTHPVTDKLFNRPPSFYDSLNLKRVGLGLFIFVFHYSLSGFLPKPAPGVADLVLASLAILVWLYFDRTLVGIIQAIITAFLGVAFEVSIISQGAFGYHDGVDTLYGVASWLPWLYVVASITIGNLGRYFFIVKGH